MLDKVVRERTPFCRTGTGTTVKAVPFMQAVSEKLWTDRGERGGERKAKPVLSIQHVPLASLVPCN